MKVWVLKCNDRKIKLIGTSVCTCYKGDEFLRPHNQVSHHDVFLSFNACNKVRCFELRLNFPLFQWEINKSFINMVPDRLGDSLGILRIGDDGTIHATFHCNQDCKRAMIKLLYTPVLVIFVIKTELRYFWSETVFTGPAKFAKHAPSSTNMSNWRTKVWVLDCKGEKIKLGETCLFRHYKGDKYMRPCNHVSTVMSSLGFLLVVLFNSFMTDVFGIL